MDETAKRRALKSIPYGLYLVGYRDEKGPNAFVGSWVTQCSFAPPMVAVAVKRDSRGFAAILKSRALTLNFLSSDQKAFATKFFKDAEPAGNTLHGAPFETAKDGCPAFTESAATLELSVDEIVTGANDHAVIVARVMEATLRREFEPLSYANTGWSYGG